TMPVVTLAALLAMIPALTLASNLVNNPVAQLRRPRRLPKLDFSNGIPAEHRAIVVVPAMLSSPEAVADTTHTLELNYLGNGDAALQFVLLTDYPDAPEEELPRDRELLDDMARRVDDLNRRYSGDGVE